MTVFTLRYDDDSGRLIGATRASDGTQFTKGGASWSDVVAWAGAQTPPVDLSDRAPPTEAERAARTRTFAAALVADGAPDRMLVRAVLKLIHAGFAEQAAWNARVRQRLTLAGLGDPGAPPVVREWAALMAALQQLITGGAGDPPAHPAPAPAPTP